MGYKIEERKMPMCPILSAKSEYVENCIGDECAWYVEGDCAISSIAQLLGNISYKIDPAIQATYTTHLPQPDTISFADYNRVMHEAALERAARDSGWRMIQPETTGGSR